MGMFVTCQVLMGIVLIVARLRVYLCGVMDCDVVGLASQTQGQSTWSEEPKLGSYVSYYQLMA